ncbi:MAG: DUF559 domain-containing protein [Pseudomonadota bacterium]
MVDEIAIARAKASRRLMTPPEARLWSRVRAGRLNGLKFKRQHPVDPYVLDFYCPEAKLAVEVDGLMHDEEHDARRTRWLNARGISVVRFPAIDVRDRVEDVLDRIVAVVSERRRTA